MPDYSGLVRVMKEAGFTATEAKNPVNVCYGKVTSTSPLKILVEQRFTLGMAQLVLTRNVTDYDIDVTVDVETTSALGSHNHSVSLEIDTGNVSASTSSANMSHEHSITGRKKIKVHNALKNGDEVILIRMQGGQKYVVIDKVV